MKNQKHQEIQNKLEKINRELACDIMILESLHKPIETAHELSRREYKVLIEKMRMIYTISVRCMRRLEFLDADKKTFEKEYKNE